MVIRIRKEGVFDQHIKELIGQFEGNTVDSQVSLVSIVMVIDLVNNNVAA